MPKMKTHSGAKKRFRSTGSGKITHRSAGIAHFRSHKPRKRLRRVDSFSILGGGDEKKIKKLLRK